MIQQIDKAVFQLAGWVDDLDPLEKIHKPTQTYSYHSDFIRPIEAVDYLYRQSDPREIGVSGGLGHGGLDSMTTASVALTAVEELALMLDSPELSALIEKIENLRWTGRPGYAIRSLVGVALAKSMYAIPTWTRTLALIREHTELRVAIGCWMDDEVPSTDACYRFTKKLRKYDGLLADCVEDVLKALKQHKPEMGKDIAIDGSSLPAYANGQRFKSKGGRERKPEEYSDPDASWGHRSAISTQIWLQAAHGRRHRH
jgi:Transposase domain (DUF772)